MVGIMGGVLVYTNNLGYIISGKAIYPIQISGDLLITLIINLQADMADFQGSGENRNQTGKSSCNHLGFV